MKMLVFRDNCKAIGTRVFPNHTVVCFVQIDVSDMLRIGKQISKAADEFVGEIMVKASLHGSMADTSLRSQSAANARKARMSSCVRSGKSSMISCSDIPEARYSSTS